MRIPRLVLNNRGRIVLMNGCMAHCRENPREGIVIGITNKKVYGDTKERPYAQIRLDNGDIVERCAELHLWTEYNGLLEYQE